MHSFLKLLVTVGIGAVLGFLAVALALCTEGLKSWKNSIARGIIHDGAPHGILRAAIFHSGYSTGLILIGSCLVRPTLMRASSHEAQGTSRTCQLSTSSSLCQMSCLADSSVLPGRPNAMTLALVLRRLNSGRLLLLQRECH